MKSSFTGSIIIAVLLLWTSACSELADSPYPDLVFTSVNPMSDKGRASAVGFTVHGKGYVAFGRSGSRTGGLKDCWEFDPVTALWKRKSDIPAKARVKAIAIGVDTVAYIGLGFAVDKSNFYDPVGLLRDFWCYHPSTDTWVQKDSFPSTFTDACVSFYRDGNIYVGCGFHNAFSAEMWKYSIKTDSWSRLKDFPGGRRACAVISADDKHIYLGTGFNTNNLNDWWEYFPDKDSWEKLQKIPDKGRQNAVSLAVENHYFVSTGRYFAGSLTGGHLKDDIIEYDPREDVWYRRGTVPAEGRTNAVAFTIDGKGYIGFGENDKGILNDMWSFDVGP